MPSFKWFFDEGSSIFTPNRVSTQEVVPAKKRKAIPAKHGKLVTAKKGKKNKRLRSRRQHQHRKPLRLNQM